MFKLISILVFSCFLIYFLLGIVVDFISKNDDEFKVTENRLAKVLISLFSGVLIGIIYIKYFFSFTFIKDYILLIYLIIVGYIDNKCKYVYDFISYRFGCIGIIICGVSIFYYNANFKAYLGSIALTFFISLIFVLLRCFSSGDLVVFTTSALFIGNITSVFNIFFAQMIAGFITIIIKIFSKKIKLSDGISICEYIAISTYLILLFVQ